MLKRLVLALLGTGLLLAARPARAGEGDNLLADELVLKSAGLPVDGAGLLAFFRGRIQGASPDRVAALVAQFRSKDGLEREKAAGELVAVGPPAVPALRAAAKDPDDAASGLARRCLTALEAESGALSAAVVRLTAARGPDGAAAALLAYLPYAEDDAVREEIRAALAGMAYHDGKADPALLKALEDQSPLRRSLAVDVLCENGLAEPRDALRKLLADPKPSVRLRAALALAQARDANAVSTLVDLLVELPAAQGRYAEDYLSTLAGDEAPEGAKIGLADDAARAKVHDAWAGWWKSTEGAACLDEFTRRTLTEGDREKAEKLIRELGDDSFDVRQKAKADLKHMGVVVVRMLKAAAVVHGEYEMNQGAITVLQEIEKDKKAPLSPVAARVVALRKPRGAAEVMLAYLPFCDDEGVLAEVQAALNAVAYPDGKPDPVLVKALGDKAAVRRGAAAEALCFGPLGDNLPAVKVLLKDDQPAVRLQAALSLAGGPHDRDAVPALIALVGEPNGDAAGAAEDYLTRLAADHGPPDLPSGDAARPARRDKWATWWKDNGGRVALVDRYGASAYQRYLGYTLLVQPNNSQIVELGADGKERCKLTGLLGPQDVQGLPGDRYLVTEANGQRVTERNAKGDVQWTKQLPNLAPISARRLPNGNTFIVCRNQILECTRDGKDVYVINRPNNDVLTAGKSRNNEIVIISSMQKVERIDRGGKELKSFPIQNTWMVGNDILPNGNVLIAFQPPLNKVVEYNADGKQVWDSGVVMNPAAAARSPNGNTLIVSQQWPPQIVEVDRNNKEVGRISQPIYTMRVRRR